MDHDKTHGEPGKVAAEGGDVSVDGPDGVAVTLTPDAAVETSYRLLESGLEGQGQQLDARAKGKRPSRDD